MAEPPQPGPWFILRRAAPVRHDADAVDDPEELSLGLPLDEPPSVCRITALTRLDRDPTYHGGGVDEHPRVVATYKDHLLLHVSGSPSGFNLDPTREGVFFLARFFEPHVNAAGRNAFKANAVCLPRRTPELPPFSGTRSLGLLRLPQGAFVVAELQAATHRSDPTLVPFITLITERSDKKKWEYHWKYHNLAWTIVDDKANPQWITHDVIAHDQKLWWVNLLRGLLVCNPVPAKDLLPTLDFVQLPVLPGLENRHEPPDQIDRYRIVRVSDRKVRFVDVARHRDEPQGETRVVVWTLDDSPSIIADARWDHHQCMTRLTNIWAHDSYIRSDMPVGVPVLALVHPSKPAVVYFFLEQYVFSVNVNENAVKEYAVMPVQDGPVALPWPINQHDVLAWMRTPFRMSRMSTIIAEELDIHDVAPDEGDQQPLAPSPDLTSEDEGTT